MKIQSISVYQVDLPLVEGSYNWSEGKSVSVFDSTIVKIETDAGIDGYGEVCPLGPVYLPSYAEGARTGIAHIAPELIGEDPLNIKGVNRKMDAMLKGHPYAKSPLDMALWDIAGKVYDASVCQLLGGAQSSEVALYRAISQESPEQMAKKVAGYKKEGYTKFQLKVGGSVNEDIDRIKAVAELMDSGNILVADANTGWTKSEALRVVRAVRNQDVFIEQPCPSYEECLEIRKKTTLPFILDECIYDLPGLIRAIREGAMDVVNIKISKVGGISEARKLRDICESAGIGMTIEDSWGGDITTAAICQLAQSTLSRYQFSATDFNSYVTVSFADGAPQRENGAMSTSTRPGLGVDVREKELKKAVASYGNDG